MENCNSQRVLFSHSTTTRAVHFLLLPFQISLTFYLETLHVKGEIIAASFDSITNEMFSIQRTFKTENCDACVNGSVKSLSLECITILSDF